MSQIFVLVVVAFVLLVSAIVFNTAHADSGSSAEGLDSIVELLGTGLEISTVVPLVLFVALFVAVLGVWGRI